MGLSGPGLGLQEPQLGIPNRDRWTYGRTEGQTYGWTEIPPLFYGTLFNSGPPPKKMIPHCLWGQDLGLLGKDWDSWAKIGDSWVKLEDCWAKHGDSWAKIGDFKAKLGDL